MPLQRANQVRFWISNLPWKDATTFGSAFRGNCEVGRFHGFVFRSRANGAGDSSGIVPAGFDGVAALGALQLLDLGIGYAAGNRIAVARLEHPRRSREVVGAMLVFYLAISLGLFCGLQLLRRGWFPPYGLSRNGLGRLADRDHKLATTGFSGCSS